MGEGKHSGSLFQRKMPWRGWVFGAAGRGAWCAWRAWCFFFFFSSFSCLLVKGAECACHTEKERDSTLDDALLPSIGRGSTRDY